MSNIIVSGDFVDLGTITSRSETAAYPDDNVEDYWFLRRRFRAADDDVNDWLLRFDFGAATPVEGVFLNGVNFDQVIIQGDGSGTFATPPFTSATASIILDERVNRHKVFIPLTAFNNQNLEIRIPAGTNATGTYQTLWEVGSVVVLHSIQTLTHNMIWGYKRRAEKPYEDIIQPHGGIERVNLGDNYQWLGNAIFGKRTVTEEADLWTLNLIDLADPMIFYENDSDTSKAYLCVRDDAYEGTLEYLDLTIGNAIRFKELV